MRRCIRCKKKQSEKEFYSNGRGGKRTRCRTCDRRRWLELFEKRKQEVLDIRLRKRLRYTHGMTLEQYREMDAAQGSRCAICSEKCTMNARLSVDHDHSTGRIRALLCNACNTGIGKMKDSQEILRNAADYLDAHTFQPLAVLRPHHLV